MKKKEMIEANFESRTGIESEFSQLTEIPQELPFLKAICWQITDVKRFTPKEMLGLYEDGWHYLGVLEEPSPEELKFIKQLISRYGSWLVNDV